MHLLFVSRYSFLLRPDTAEAGKEKIGAAMNLCMSSQQGTTADVGAYSTLLGMSCK